MRSRAARRGRRQCRGGIPGGDGRGVRRPRRRRPARPGRDQFLWRVDHFFHNLGQGAFADRTSAIGLAAPSRYLLGFGIAFVDVEQRRPARPDDGQRARQRLSSERPLCHAGPAPAGGSKGADCETSPRRPARHSGPPTWAAGSRPATSTTTAGSTSLVVAQNEPLVYPAQPDPAGHFVTLALEGTTSNRDGVGASVAVVRGRPSVARCNESAAGATSRPAIRGSTSAWERPAHRPARSAVAVGPVDRHRDLRGRHRLSPPRGGLPRRQAAGLEMSLESAIVVSGQPDNSRPMHHLDRPIRDLTGLVPLAETRRPQQGAKGSLNGLS